MSYNPFTLEGKTILITGASSGIGRATAIECSKMGANVVITARNEERLAETASQMGGGNNQVLTADITVDDELKNLIAQLPELDGAVLCAGRGLTVPLKMASRSKMDTVFNTNFFAQTELTRLIYKEKKLKKGSSLVLISSVGGNYRFEVGGGIYGASKAALNSFMKFAAKEFSARLIRVNSVCPDMVETPLIHRGTITEEQLAKDMQNSPLGRYGKPEEVAYAAIYLLSDAAAWVTGTSLVIDGGMTSNK